jgi:adenine-specific DNA-methyltransferase
LSFIERRLRLAKRLLRTDNAVLIVTIDDKEYLHLGCLLEQLFPDARIQMISDVINPKGTMQRKIFILKK